MIRRQVSIAVTAVLLAFGSLLGTARPTLAAPGLTLECYGWPSETIAHWNSAFIESEYGRGVHVTRVQFQWEFTTVFGSGSEYSYAWARIEGDNARAGTPFFFTAQATAAALLSDNRVLYSPTVVCRDTGGNA
jgi:hypothetical protein